MTRSTPRSLASICLGFVAMAAVPVLSGCDYLTREEAQEAYDEFRLVSEAASLTTGAITLTTDFTLGQARDVALEELRDFVSTQLPCAEVSLADATVSITYGATGESCEYRGQRYEGTHAVTLSEISESQAVLVHNFDGLRNGSISVSGSATVTWDGVTETRRVVHELNWTRLLDGRTGTGSGDRVQSAAAGGLEEGFRVSGNRAWEGASGRWDLTIDDVTFRWADPVPESGVYTLTTPRGVDASARFERLDEATIRVTLSGPRRSYDFDVR